MGAGFEFKRELLEGVQDKSLVEIMADGRAVNNSEFELVDQKKGGVVRWVQPPETGRDYFVIGDPGQGLRPPAMRPW